MARGMAATTSAGARLRGRWLLAARIAWVAVAALALALVVVGLPGLLALSERTCRLGYLCTRDQLPSAAVQQLRDAGLSLAFFGWYSVGLKCLTTLVFVAVALVIFWRAPAERVALVAAFTFVTFPLTLTHVASTVPTALVVAAQILDVLGSSGMVLLLSIFPNGHFVPRWTRWVCLANPIFYGMNIFFPDVATGVRSSPLPLLALVACLAAVQVYRYQRVSSPIERQQTKWVVLGVAGGFVAFILIISTFVIVPDLASRSILLFLVLSVLNFFSLMLIPLAFGVAILRYRLWDVDALIGKVLVYGLLTGLLGALYVGMILALENLAGRFTHQGPDNPLALVVSTLAIAALVQPARRRLQHLIDRRFYRAKHDAARTLETFGAALRQQTDLEQVRAQLLVVVTETMQPAHASLWLRAPAAQRGER